DVDAGAKEYTDGWVIGLYVSSLNPKLSKTYQSKDKYKDRVFINEAGLRFVNENLPYLTDAVATQKKAWAIVDSSDARKAELLDANKDPAVAVKGATWAELAAAMGVPAEALVKTMGDYNKACETGEDLAFGKPKAFLKPFAKAPFYAVRVVPQTGGTMGGVAVNDKFQVLRADGSVIKGLYAGGEVVNRPFYNRVYTSGSGLGIAYTSGRIAGTWAARE
ncbi:MAG: FAD-binding protein, partial [Duodenibacillus sp.]|nr:FAD-binding protein [Duodenibacillus sp.]